MKTQPSKNMSKTIKKPQTDAVDLNRLIRYWDSRKESLKAEYERHRGDRMMESIISGQLIEIEKIERFFLPVKEVWDD